MRPSKRFSLVNLVLLSAVSVAIWYVVTVQFEAPLWMAFVGAVAWGLISPFHIFVRK